MPVEEKVAPDASLARSPLSTGALLEFDAVVTGAPVGIAFTRNQLIVHANPHLCAVFGYLSAELVGQPASVCFSSTPGTYEELGRIAGPALAAGQPFSATLPASRKDGSLIWARVSANAVRSENGPDGTVWFVEDVTAEHARAETLRHTLIEQQTIFENAAVGILYSNKRVIVRCNQRLSHIFGYEPHELLGLTTRVLYASDAAYKAIDLETAPILQAGQAVSVEKQFPHRDGHLLWIHMTGRQVADSAHVNEDIIWILEDVSERRRAQDTLLKTQAALAQVEKLAGLGSLVVGVAHELNTPIGISLTASSTLRDRARALQEAVGRGDLKRSQLDSFLRDLTGISDLLVRSCERAAELVSGFKQVAVNPQSEQRQTFNLRAVVEGCVAAQRTQFPETPVQVTANIPADIECDSYPVALTEVTNNLIHNALTHAFDGRAQGTLKVSVLNGDWVELRFEDDGVGMEPGNLARIFDPFFTTRLGHGRSGLGLSITRNLVTAVLAGALTAESKPKQGSCFLLRFPKIAPTRALTPADTP